MPLPICEPKTHASNTLLVQLDVIVRQAVEIMDEPPVRLINSNFSSDTALAQRPNRIVMVSQITVYEKGVIPHH